MAENNEIISLQHYKKKSHWNIGLVLFGVIFVYLAVTIVTYLTKDRVAVYEVRQGSILKDTDYTGIVLREEKIVSAEQDGYVNYFLEEGQKAAFHSNIYTLTPQKLPEVKSTEAEEEFALRSDEWNSILTRAQAFNESYRPEDFHAAVTLLNETDSILKSNTAQNRMTHLNTLLLEGGVDGMQVYGAPEDGIIEYSVDGYETLTLDELTDRHLDKTGYISASIENNTQVSAGDAVCRLITGEEWTVVIKLTAEMEDTFRAKMDGKTDLNVKIRFVKDNQTLNGNLQIYNRGKDDAYGYITFNHSMIRYANDRFLEVELILEDESGLKIPKSSVTEKEFYFVPTDFLTTDPSSSETGVLLETKDRKGNASSEFCGVTVYGRDEQNGIVYIDPGGMKKGDVLVMPNASEKLTLGDTDTLYGVYNVNKGYAVFKLVNILCESEEYYIIEKGNNYGLSNYDRIALDGSVVRENDIVIQ
ncbi:MAG: hypothetical protein HFG41_02170 [Coprococcus sp.]|nr:hypothetical protein [Coprococcus sp.]